MGENGIICAADEHACKECTQPYKKTADIITGDNPAALVGVDENRAVPALVGEGDNLPAEADEQARQNTSEAASAVNEEMNIDDLPACDSELFHSRPLLLCRNDMCSMWCSNSMGKV